ncbi:MAG: ABC transporter permease [Marinicellaceae bacterium]
MFTYFFKREIRDKYLGNLTGFSWIFIQPIITLIIYWFVFDQIFTQRFSDGEQSVGFIVYLAIGFWPWLAFSESVISSITAVSDKTELIGKIKIDLKTLVFATIVAKFSLHMIGYLIVLFGLTIFYETLSFSSIIFIIFPLFQMFLFALALGFLLSSIHIFIRDTLQFMTTFMTLWFFTTPIIYSVSIIPVKYLSIIQINPLYIPITFIHNAILGTGELMWLNLGVLTLITLLMLFLSIRVFNKLSPNFEDFK